MKYQECGRLFISETDDFSHIQLHCKFCNEIFNGISGFQKHMRFNHRCDLERSSHRSDTRVDRSFYENHSSENMLPKHYGSDTRANHHRSERYNDNFGEKKQSNGKNHENMPLNHNNQQGFRYNGSSVNNYHWNGSFNGNVPKKQSDSGKSTSAIRNHTSNDRNDDKQPSKRTSCDSGNIHCRKLRRSLSISFSLKIIKHFRKSTDQKGTI